MDLRFKKTVDLYVGGSLLALARPAAGLLGALLRRDHNLHPRGRIGVIKLLGGGSLLLALPALLGIRRRWQGRPLFLVTTRETRPFAELLGVFDEIVSVDDSTVGRLFVSGLDALRESFRADTLLDLEVYSRLTTVLSLATLARNRVSFYVESVFWRRHVATHLIFFNRSSGVYHFYDQLARLLDAEPATIEDCRRHLAGRLPRPSPHAARRYSIGHGCSSLGLERRLDPEQWRLILAPRLGRTPAELDLLGAAGDRALGDAIARRLAEAGLPWTVRNRSGELSLQESVALIAGSERYFGVDSALLHFARFLGVPSTSAWGPTAPNTLLRPIPGLEEEVLYRPITCSPCIHATETPPCGGENLCIRHLFDPHGTPAPRPLWVVPP